MKIISLTSASTRVNGATVALDKGAEVDLPDAKANHLIKVGIVKAVESEAPATRRETKSRRTAEPESAGE